MQPDLFQVISTCFPPSGLDHSRRRDRLQLSHDHGMDHASIWPVSRRAHFGLNDVPGPRRGRVLPWKTTSLGACLLVSVFVPQVLAEPLPLKDQPVPGWPGLDIQTHYVARIALRGHCFPVPLGTPIPNANFDSCARPDFWRGVCDIFIDVQSERRDALREHEEKRCRGYDYRGEDGLAEAWRAWREHGENRYADMLDFESMMFVSEGSPEGRVQYEERAGQPR